VPYDYRTHLTSPNQSGRRQKKITSITIHWWGDPNHFGDAARDGDPERIAQYLCRKNGTSSAHYVVTAGEVWCIVDPDNIAWHAGNWPANETSIGIECDADHQDGTYETVAELIAELREIYGNLPLVPHRQWQSTQCPGAWDLEKLDRMARQIQMKKDTGSGLGGGTAKPPAKQKIDIRPLQEAVRTWKDNIWGPDTDKRLRAVKSASLWYGPLFPFHVPFTQSVVGTKPDGVWGPKSRKAHDQTVKRIQKSLKNLRVYHGEIDGIYGPMTDSGVSKARALSRA
jgi:hypothetical protein